jgi:hypothetical protein
MCLSIHNHDAAPVKHQASDFPPEIAVRKYLELLELQCPAYSI